MIVTTFEPFSMTKADIIFDVFQQIVFTGSIKECVQWLNHNPKKRRGYDVLMALNECLVTVDEYLENFPDGSMPDIKHHGEFAWWLPEGWPQRR